MTSTDIKAARAPETIVSGPAHPGYVTSEVREPKRDWSLGPVTGHRVTVVLCMALSVFALYQLQGFLWPVGRPAHGWFEHAWSYGAVLWLSAVVPGAMGLVGLLAFRHAERLDEVRAIPCLVSWRIVSRGDNVEALTATIRRCQREMARTPLFPYVIEVVTDLLSTHMPPPNEDLVYIAVPPKYRTPKGTLYKARALQFALETSTLPDDAWIVHLDEETHPTSSGIKGIARMISEEEQAGTYRIGQGAILYHRDWRTHPFLTLADMVRTGDDFARFHFQTRLNRTVFGMHGSYIVVRNDVEKSSGFDFGPVGSITEDAFWALVCMEIGHRCRWVDGYLEEQSTRSIGDFVRQRRRWFQGLAKVALFAPVKPRWRLSLGINTALWALAPFGLLYTIGHLVYGFQVEPWIRALANGSFASFLTLYILGLKTNLAEHGITGWRSVGWTAAQAVLLPVFSAMEAVGVLAAILKPVAGFHVVKK
jgi:egghead protein (zeste-white 4 protein)